MSKVTELELQLAGASSHYKKLLTDIMVAEHLANEQTKYIERLEAKLEELKGENRND
jgi:hypothetical protein